MKRRAFSIKVLLFVFALAMAGAIINVAVAWGIVCALQPADATNQAFAARIEPTWVLEILRAERTGSTYIFCCWTDGTSSAISKFLTPDELLPKWSNFDPVAFGLRTEGVIPVTREYREHIALGLPCRTLCADFSDTRPFTERPQWVGAIECKWRYKDGSKRIFPIHPIFPGFAINTIFYAAVLWVLFAVPLKVRRWRRIKRGVCVRCAYPVGASAVCSECGTPVKALHGAPPPATPA
jgi:hypothetical protein